MYCAFCGRTIEDNSTVCPLCGHDPLSGQDIKAVKEKAEFVIDAKSIFVEPDEQVLGTLGNGFGVNILYGNAKKTNAILTDKRLYLEGAMYSSNGNSLIKSTERRIVNVDDITATGLIYEKLSILMVILGIITLPIIIGIVFLAKAFLSRTTFFFIDYAGGRIQFDVKIVGLSDVADFQKQICRAKDKAKGKI